KNGQPEAIHNSGITAADYDGLFFQPHRGYPITNAHTGEATLVLVGDQSPRTPRSPNPYTPQLTPQQFINDFYTATPDEQLTYQMILDACGLESFAGADLSNCYLSGIDFTGA